MSLLKPLQYAAVIVCVLVAVQCPASMITYEFTGEVTSVDDGTTTFPTEFLGTVVGDSISVLISYDTSVAGTPGAGIGSGTLYEFTPSQASMTVLVNGEFLAIDALGFQIDVANDYAVPFGTRDAFLMRSVQQISETSRQEFTIRQYDAPQRQTE